MANFYVGVDGGASKCIVRLEDEAGKLIACERAGPANIRISVVDSWQEILKALNKIIVSNAIPSHATLKAGMGLAGVEIAEAYQAFIHFPHPFQSLIVTSDAHTACLGAHGGRDGSIIIAGTGVVGYEIQQGQTRKVSGWGFPHDDIGSGAWMGLEAAKLTWQSLDGRRDTTALTQAVFAHFKMDQSAFLIWSNTTNSSGFATLAPIVIELSQQGDSQAIAILKQAATALDLVSDALTPTLPCTLIGGVSDYLKPYVGQALSSRLSACMGTPDAGAILLIRQGL